MAFRGWPAEAVEFYEGLRADNSKPYWTDHKDVYEASVYAPMADLIGELADEFGPARISRPYRDVRFHADKTPYKIGIYATLQGGGYVRFSADGLTAGSGYYRMAPDQLARYRAAVDDDAGGGELSAVLDRLRAKSIEVGGADSLKTAPKGYPKDHPRVGLLRHKSLIAWRDWPVEGWLSTAAAKRRVVDLLRATAPMRAWLDAHVGPSTEPEPRR